MRPDSILSKREREREGGRERERERDLAQPNQPFQRGLI